MNKLIIKEELKWLIEAINEQFETIRSYDDKIPQIELDILMDNVRKFYDDMRKLQIINDMHLLPNQGESHPGMVPQPAKEHTPGSVVPSTPGDTPHPARVTITAPTTPGLGSHPAFTPSGTSAVSSLPDSGRLAENNQHQGQPGPFDFQPPSPKPAYAEASKPPTVSFSADVTKPSPIQSTGASIPPVSNIPHTLPGVGPVSREPDKGQENFPAFKVKFEPPQAPLREIPASAKKSRKQPEIDLFAAEEPEFSIRLKEARDKTLAPRGVSERIDNLKSAITINDKFMFINELFDGNLREYNETIETLNGFKTLDQAGDYLDLMRRKNFWDTGSNAFKKLQELVEKKF